MSQGFFNLVLDQGSDKPKVFQCRASDGSASDLNGYTDVKCYIARAALSDNPVELPVEFVAADDSSSAVGTATGQIRLMPTGTLTRPLTYRSGVWQIWVTAPTGERFPLLGGQLTILQQVPASAA